MDQTGTECSESSKKHMYAPEEIRYAARTSGDADLTRGHGQGNGVRVHGTYVAVVLLAALVLVVGGIALAARMM